MERITRKISAADLPSDEVGGASNAPRAVDDIVVGGAVERDVVVSIEFTNDLRSAFINHIGGARFPLALADAAPQLTAANHGVV